MKRLKDLKPDASNKGVGEFFVKIIYADTGKVIANFASTYGFIREDGIDYFVQTEDFGWDVRMIVSPGGVVLESSIVSAESGVHAVGESGSVLIFRHNPPSASCESYETEVYDRDNQRIVVSGRFNFA